MDITRQPEGGLIQSSQWADFLRAKGERILTIGNNIFGVVHTLKIVGQYLYAPRLTEAQQEMIEEMIAKAQTEDCGWVRVDVGDGKTLNALKNSGKKIVRAPHDMQPRENFIVDISGSEEELRTQMKSKTRYNIKLAEKKNVAIHCVTKNDEDFDQMLDLFYAMIEETARRKGVRFHSKEHYRKMFDALPEDAITLFAAEVDGGVFIAANIVTFYNNTATYLHGATADTHRNFMAPFLLQWAAIRAAKGRGYRWYDFGGIKSAQKNSDKSGSKNDWAGITRFKKGFSPTTAPTLGQGSYDIILNAPKYYLYRILQKMRNMIS